MSEPGQIGTTQTGAAWSGPSDDASRALAARLEATLCERLGHPVQVQGLAPLAGGACQENAALDLLLPDGRVQPLVLRGDAASSLPGSLRRAAEFEVVRAAVAAGVPSPTPRWLLPGLAGPGRDAWLMDRAAGEALGRRLVAHPDLAAAREVLVDQVAGALAALRRVRPEEHPDLPLDREVLAHGDPALQAVAFVRRMLDALPGPQPALELVAAWLDHHRPPPPPELCLVHGDLRTGNLLVERDGLTALLDYEFAHWGDPAEDMAWLCVRDWRFGRLDRAAGGFATRAALIRAVSQATGAPPDPARLHWWEVLGNLRWAAGALYQGERFLSGEVLDLELLAIPWRAAEMTFEALRLVASAGGLGASGAGGLGASGAGGLGASGAGGLGAASRAPGPALPPARPSSSRPDEATVLRATALFLEQDLRRRVDDKAMAFRARIAAHLLTVVATWQEVGAEVERQDLAAFRALLGQPDAGPSPAPDALPAARADLARALRDGLLPAEAALPVLMARLRAELAVRSPTFDPDARVD